MINVPCHHFICSLNFTFPFVVQIRFSATIFHERLEIDDSISQCGSFYVIKQRFELTFFSAVELYEILKYPSSLLVACEY